MAGSAPEGVLVAPALLVPGAAVERPGLVRHVAALDGVRAFAVAAVLAHHIGFPLASTAWFGVDIFFVLSGFLITTLLVREQDQYGGIDLSRFWLRRAFRLLPAYWLYIGVITVMLLLREPGDFTPRGAWTPGTFIASLWLYFINAAPDGLWVHQPLTFHLWSLAVEEQFYFSWPLVLVLLMRLERPWLPVLGAMFALQIWGAIAGIQSNHFVDSLQRVPGLLAGCASALFFARRREHPLARAFTDGRARNVALGLAACVLAVGPALEAAGYSAGTRDPIVRYCVLPPLVIGLAAYLGGVWYGRGDAVTRALAVRPLPYVGKISYGLYLYHLPAVWVSREWFVTQYTALFGERPRYLLIAIMFLCVTLIAAIVSHHTLEQRFLRYKDRMRPRARP